MMTPSSSDPEIVRVPITEPDHPFGDSEYAEMTPEAAEHWDRRRWGELR